MINRLLDRLRKPRVDDATASAPSVPEGVVVWAVGDIHGRLDLLRPLTEAMLENARRSPAARKVVIFLGDYIDRGPDSRGVLTYLAGLEGQALAEERGIEWRFLKGNHEETMLAFLDDPSVGAQWCEYGGDATLKSYGLRPPQLRHRAEAWRALSADLAHRVSPQERAFLERLELSATVGDYFFVHAGARPGVALDSQSERDLLWVRRSFLDSDAAFDRLVVHGHTPVEQAHLDHRRAGIDTGAYRSGVLTCLRLEGETRRLIQTRPGPSGEGGAVHVVERPA